MTALLVEYIIFWSPDIKIKNFPVRKTGYSNLWLICQAANLKGKILMKRNRSKILMGVLILFFSLKGLALPTVRNDSIVYVWDFSVSDSSIKEIGTMLTNDFETELINSGLYTVLERRRYNRVLAHQDLEKKIADMSNMPSAAIDSLRANRAEVVIFGEVIEDEKDGLFEVMVTFQSLNGVNLRKASIVLQRSLADNNQARKNAVKNLMKKLHDKEAMASKKQQYDLISGILATYMVRLQDVQTRFQDISRYAFDNQGYFDELNNTIIAYNHSFDTLTANRAKYHIDFIREWNNRRGQELEDIFSNILDDIHITYILKLDKVKLAIAEYQQSKGGKKEKEKMRKDILKSVKETTDDLGREINKMHKEINPFLAHLRVEMSE